MSIQKGHKKKEIKTDPASFEGKGLFFTAKFIGVSDVADFRGNAMCQETMQKLKAAVKSSGKHKLKILVNISLEGIKLIEEKTMAVNYEHIVSRISFISIDTTDSRAFGYVFEPGDGTHKFFAIKTEKSAGHVIIAIRDLFETVFEMKKKERDEAAQKEAEEKDKSAVCSAADGAAPVAATADKANTDETDYGYSGMDSMGTALESFDDFPFGQVTTGDTTADPWNINNSKQCIGNASASIAAAAAAAPVVLLPPPPASPRVPIGSAMPQAPAALPPGQCSLAANLFPASSAFPSAVSSNVPAQPFPVSVPLTVNPAVPMTANPAVPMAANPAVPMTVNPAVPKPTDPATTPPEMPTSMTCSLPIVTDPFGDKLFVSAVPAQVPSQTPFAASTATTPPTTDNTVPFAAFPVMKPPRGNTFPVATQNAAANFAAQQPFAAFPPDPAQPVAGNAFSAAFPVQPPTPVSGFPVGQQQSFAAFPEGTQPAFLPLSSPDSSQRSTPSKFDAISLDSSFTSVFSQQSNEKLESGSTSANNKPPTDTGTNPVPQPDKLFQDLCNFGSNQHHKKPAELFPKLEPPPSKKLSELLEESIKCKEINVQNPKTENPLPTQQQQQQQQSEQDATPSNTDQASEYSITSALPAENLLTDPAYFPEPTKFDQPSVSAASFPGSDPQSSNVSNDRSHSDSPSIFSFSGNNPTEVTYAMTKLKLSDVDFNNPPSHPPPQLPSHLLAAVASGHNSGSESVCSISPFPDDHWTISDDEFNLPSPTVPPPPLPTGASLNFEPDQAPAPPPRPRTSDITRTAKPPPLPVRPKRTLSSSSSLQSMGKSNSPVSSVVSLEGTVLAHGAISDCSFTSLQDSDVSTNSLPMTKLADTKVNTTKFTDRGSSVSSPLSVATGNSNCSPPPWSAFTENDNSSSPFSNQSFSSGGRDVFASNSSQTALGTASSHDSGWPNNNPFMSKVNTSPSVRNSSSPDPFSGPYTKIVDKRSKQTPQTISQSVESVCSSTSAQIHNKSSQPGFNSVDPFRVHPCTKPQSNHNQTNTNISGSFCSELKNDLSDPFVVPLHLKLQTEKSPVDPFVIQTNVNLTQNNTQVTQFFPSTKNTERSLPETDPFTYNSQTTNIENDPFTTLSRNSGHSGNVPSDPFFSPSHNPAEYSQTQTDPFDAFNQWPVSTKFSVDIDKSNGH
ncbi:disabled homolog 1-like isoform X1 [Octopus vulgaris]|uniref:Disabled homolog 1-like isoform X1 n=2 Tax=Octopus vulgaris TaxID=6645 RepID=A0AA36ASP4_OCTVU|nr:disabled homolog 1-like isoform X1 [Octopus vulgaris]